MIVEEDVLWNPFFVETLLWKLSFLIFCCGTVVVEYLLCFGCGAFLVGSFVVEPFVVESSVLNSCC